jgi:hypothetical protein
MSLRMVGLVIWLTGVGLLSVPAHGLEDGALRARVNGADIVAHARCTDVTAQWRDNRVVSVARYQVISDIKGAGAAQLEVSIPGGTAMHPRLNVPVTTQLSHGIRVQPGDEAVLFVRETTARNGIVSRHLLSLQSVSVDARGEKRLDGATRSTTKRVTVPARANSPPTVVIRHERQRIDEFVNELKSMVEKK